MLLELMRKEHIPAVSTVQESIAVPKQRLGTRIGMQRKSRKAGFPDALLPATSGTHS